MRPTRASLLTITMIALLSIFFTARCPAQAPQLNWKHSFGGTADDQALSTAATTDGGVIVVGSTASNNGDITGQHGAGDLYVIKLNPGGGVEWQKQYGGSTGASAGYGVTPTRDGGYAVIGKTAASNGDVTAKYGSEDIWLLKLSATGAVQWQKTFGGSNYDIGMAIKQTYDGGYFVCGAVMSTDVDGVGNHGDWDGIVLRLDSTGAIVWKSLLGGVRYELMNNLALTSDSGCIVIGESMSFGGMVHGYHGGNGPDCWIVKLNKNGGVQWDTCYGGTLDDYGDGICVTPTGYMITGYFTSNDGDISGNHGSYDIWVAKLTTAGKIVWKKCIGSNSFDQGYTINKSYTNTYYIGGMSGAANGDIPTNNGRDNFTLIELDSNGTVNWITTAGGNSGDDAYAAVQTTDSGYVLVGPSWSDTFDITDHHGQAGFADAWVVKFGGRMGGSCTATSTSSIAFGTVTTCHTGVDTFLVVTNTGTTTMSVDTLGKPTHWSVRSSMPRTIAAGASDTVQLRFLPQQLQTTAVDSVVLFSRACNVRMVTALTGRMDTVTFATTPAIAMPTVFSCGAGRDTTIVLTNTSGQLISVDTLDTPPNWVVVSQMPRHIPAGSVDMITMQFIPRAHDTLLVDTVTFISQPCGVRRTTVLSGRVDSLNTVAPPPLVVMGVPVCRMPLDTFVVVQNLSPVPVVLRATMMPHTFTVLSTLPDTVPSMGADTIRVRFDAAGGAIVFDTMRLGIMPCERTMMITMIARADSIFTVTDGVAFGTIELPGSKCDSIVINNLRDATLHLASLSLPPGVTLEGPAVPCNIPVNGSRAFVVCYAPDSAGHLDSGAYATFDEPCDVTIRVGITGTATTAAAVEGAITAIDAALGTNYPDPFSDRTTLHVALPPWAVRGARLRVLDIIGREVVDLTSHLGAGSLVPFDAAHLAPGTYFTVLNASGHTMVRPMHVVR
jgi:hypothetical protein